MQSTRTNRKIGEIRPPVQAGEFQRLALDADPGAGLPGERDIALHAGDLDVVVEALREPGGGLQVKAEHWSFLP